jgi:hypothetical protein
MNKKIFFIVGAVVLLLISIGGYFYTQSEKKISDINDFYSITASYPKESLDTKKVMENFVMYKVKEKQEEWKLGGKAYKEEQKTVKDFPDRPKMQYQYMISYKKYTSSVYKTVSYVFTTYEFTGGANGNTTISTFTFNKDGKVEIDSVLSLATSDNDIKLSRLLADTAMINTQAGFDKTMLYDGLGLSYLKSDGKTLDKAKCHCDGFFFGSNFQNFIITDEGIRFIFSKYQIAPGSFGTPEVELSWKQLQGYILGTFKGK